MEHVQYNTRRLIVPDAILSFLYRFVCSLITYHIYYVYTKQDDSEII